VIAELRHERLVHSGIERPILQGLKLANERGVFVTEAGVLGEVVRGGCTDIRDRSLSRR
jgi:hypothetical protein